MTKRIIRDPYGSYIVKEEGPTEEEEAAARQRYYAAEMALLKQEKSAKERKQLERVKTLNASLANERQKQKQVQSNLWQLDLHEIILDRRVR